MSDLAQLHRDVVFGRADGKIIWQPRIGCWFSDKLFAGEPLPGPYQGMSLPEIYRSLGCSSRLYTWYNRCLRRIEPPAVRRMTEQLNDTDTRTTIQTPIGAQVRVDRSTPNSPQTIHLKWPVETEEELRVATWIEENTTWEWGQAEFEKCQSLVGDLGAPTVYLPRSNVQDLYISQMGVANGVYALSDWPETIEGYFQALDDSHDRLIDVVNASPIEIINLGENLHASTMSPHLFERYHLPGCQHRCERLHEAGKFVSSHWDGHCGPLLKYAKETGLDGIEAITPRPQGDVTLEEVKDALGDDLFYLDGIPAVYFDETYTIDVLLACARRIIEMFAPKLVLGISDELSSTGDIERIRLVGELVDEYNAGHSSSG